MLYCSELMRRALFLQCTEYSSECLFRASVSVCRSRIFKPLLHCRIHNVICRQHSEATVDWTNCMVTSYQTAYFDSVIVEFCWRLNRTELQFWSRRAFQWECLQRRTDWLSTNRPSFAAVNQVATQTRVTYERLVAGQFSSCAVKKRLDSPAICIHRTTRQRLVRRNYAVIAHIWYCDACCICHCALSLCNIWMPDKRCIAVYKPTLICDFRLRLLKEGQMIYREMRFR